MLPLRVESITTPKKVKLTRYFPYGYRLLLQTYNDVLFPVFDNDLVAYRPK